MKTFKLLVPLLALYIAIIFAFKSSELKGDEPRYVRYAINLSQGYYSEKNDVEIVNGPGYPLFLLPFIKLKIPLVIPKIMNAFLLFFAIVYFYPTLNLYMDERTSILSTYLTGCIFSYFQAASSTAY